MEKLDVLMFMQPVYNMIVVSIFLNTGDSRRNWREHRLAGFSRPKINCMFSQGLHLNQLLPSRIPLNNYYHSCSCTKNHYLTYTSCTTMNMQNCISFTCNSGLKCSDTRTCRLYLDLHSLLPPPPC